MSLYGSDGFHAFFNSQDQKSQKTLKCQKAKRKKTWKENGHQIHDHAYHVVSLNLFLILLTSFCFLFIYCCSFMLIYIWFNDIVVIITHINIKV